MRTVQFEDGLASLIDVMLDNIALVKVNSYSEGYAAGFEKGHVEGYRAAAAGEPFDLSLGTSWDQNESEGQGTARNWDDEVGAGDHN